MKKRQRYLAWASARAHARRAALHVPDIVCTYGAEVDEDTLEAAVLAETGMKTPWIKYALDEFVERLKRDLPTYHEEAPAPEEAPAAADITMAPADVVMAPAEAPAAADEVSLAQEFLRGRFAAATLAAAPARRGTPKAPLVCARCKKEFHSSDAKYNHVRRGKCIPV